MGAPLQTIESRWGPSINAMFDTPDARVLAPDPCLWVAFLNSGAALAGHFRPPLGRTDQPAIEVHVNHGVWQTECPWCPSAQHASRDDPWFYCARCHNEQIGRLLVPVVWPEEPEAIEELLLSVDDVRIRNWESHESVGDLEVQVALHRAGVVEMPAVGHGR